MTESEQYAFNERLALLGVIDREPTPAEIDMAFADVQRYQEESNAN